MNNLRRDLFLSSSDGSSRTIGSSSSSARYNRSKKMVAPMPLHPHHSYLPAANNNHQNTGRNTHIQPKPESTMKSSSPQFITNANEQSTISSVETEVEFQSILRIRPFSLEERGDKHLFSSPKDHDNNIIRLHRSKDRPSYSTPSRRSKDIDIIAPSEYHFDAILHDDSTQEDTYERLNGQDMARDAVAPLVVNDDNQMDSCDCRDVNNNGAKEYVIVSMGVSNSGKTFTIFGDQKHKEEGIVPRLLDDIFLSGKDLTTTTNRNHKEETKFGIQISMVHLHNDHVYDMLSLIKDDSGASSTSSSTSSSSPKRKSKVSKMIHSFESQPLNNKQRIEASMKELKIKKDRETQDFTIHPTVVTCTSSSRARTVLNEGMKNNTTTSTNLNKCSSRGHTIITIRPVLKRKSKKDVIVGDSINVIDMAGIERTKTSSVSGSAMRESVSINTSISAMLQCLRSIKNNHEKSATIPHYENNHNDIENVTPALNGTQEKMRRKSEIVPYRDNKLTMLIQPLFSGKFQGRSNVTKVKTTVKILVSVYPGTKDYNEKKTLLGEIDSIRGLKTHRSMKRKINSHNIVPSRNVEKMTSPPLEESRDSINEMILLKSGDETYNSQSTPKPKISSPFKRIANAVKSSSTKKRKAEMKELMERIHQLEDENVILSEKNEKIQKKLTSSQLENKRLKVELVNASKKAAEEENKKEENEKKDERVVSGFNAELFLREREMRWREQNLLSSPLRNHMNCVDTHSAIFCGNIKGLMVTKPSFQLSIPSVTKSSVSMMEHVEPNASEDEASTGSYSA